jgi:hypothetical protein
MFIFGSKFQAAKPKYEFLKKLPAKMDVFRTKHTVLECFVNHDDCEPKWFKNGKLIKVEHIFIYDILNN